ncbi:MAG: flavohemoglobin expression-modulating QEGLA motif protein [Verrucomicrobiales bacterium]
MSQHHPDPRYCETIRQLSARLVEAQRPLRILDAVKWGDEVEAAFFDKKCRELPPVDSEFYKARPPGFDPVAKLEELRAIELDAANSLGRLSPVGEILRRMCREYIGVVHLIEARGTPEFGAISRELYGSTAEAFHAGEPTLAGFGNTIARTLTHIDRHLSHEEPDSGELIGGEEAIGILEARLHEAFGSSGDHVRVILDDGIVADAAAGSDYIKIRRDAKFTPRELRLLEVHEGWVHIGTSLNGASQPVCTFLSKGPPSATVTQEGLAVLMEVFAFASYPARLRRLANRIRAVSMAEDGANFLEVFHFYREQGFSDRESYAYAVRTFRGSTPDGTPFTKDLSYMKGFVLIYNFIRFAVKHGKLNAIPLLFCGKTILEDIRILRHLLDEGVLKAPGFVPPQFADLHGLSAWMCYADFLSGFNNDRLEADYAGLL